MPKTLTVKALAKLMCEELERDNWGDVDPYLFRTIAEGIPADYDNSHDARALQKVLKRVVARLQ